MNLEHLISKRKFRKYLHETKDEIQEYFEDIFGWDFGEINLESKREFYRFRIKERKRLYSKINKDRFSKKERVKTHFQYLNLKISDYYKFIIPDDCPGYNYNTKTIYYPMTFLDRLSYLEKDLRNLPIHKINISHEIGHHISKFINPIFKSYIKKDFVLSFLSEGFSEYLSLDISNKLYCQNENKYVTKMKKSHLKKARKCNKTKPLKKLLKDKSVKYILGYNFFHEITKERGKREAIIALKFAEKIKPSYILSPKEYLQRFNCTTL